MRKKLLIIIITLITIINIYAVKYHTYSYKDIKGRTIVTDLYKQEESGVYKVESIFIDNEKVEQIEYYVKNKDYIDRKIFYYKNGEYIVVDIFFIKNNPLFKLKTHQENRENEQIIETEFKNNPEGYLKTVEYYTIEYGKIIKTERYLDGNNKDSTIKIIDYYYENGERKLSEAYYLNNKKYVKISKQYFGYNDLLEKREDYYEKHPNKLIKVVTYFDSNRKESKNENYFENPLDEYWKVIWYYENGIQVKVEGFDKDGNLIYEGN